METLPAGFELLFITEGAEASPAAEIPFGGQRLCVLRERQLGLTEIEFVEDKYIRSVEVRIRFPLESFTQVVNLGSRELHAWCVNLKANAQQISASDAGNPRACAMALGL